MGKFQLEINLGTVNMRTRRDISDSIINAANSCHLFYSNFGVIYDKEQNVVGSFKIIGEEELKDTI
jgi:hypothetical protein